MNYEKIFSGLLETMGLTIKNFEKTCNLELTEDHYRVLVSWACFSAKRDMKSVLLKRYSEKIPTPFLQFDIFLRGDPSNNFEPDGKGIAFTATRTWELMECALNEIRLLISADVSKADVERGLALLLISIMDDEHEGFQELLSHNTEEEATLAYFAKRNKPDNRVKG